MADMIERELGWDDTIEKDSTFTLLPAGDYRFTVVGFERARHNGSDKLPPCNKAVVTLEVTDGTNQSTITYNLFLHTRTEGMLCAFFTAIGQRQSGDSKAMNWAAVPGSTGRCKVGIREWTSKNTGEKLQGNEIKKFYEPTQAGSSPTFTTGAF